MAVRATPSDVVSITGSTVDDTTIQVFINVANTLINQAVTEGCSITSVTVLTQAESFLAAHLLMLSGVSEGKGGQLKTKERFENYSVEYGIAQLQGDGVTLTTYGQTANMLMGGCLSNLNSEQASIGFFG